MDSSEHELFSRLEHELGRDLSAWRRDIVHRFESCFVAAYDIEASTRGGVLDVNDLTVRQAIRSRLIDLLAADWLRLADSPSHGDFISVTGETFWHTPSLDDAPLVSKLPAGHKIQGEMAHWDIAPYVDEAGLEGDTYRQPEHIFSHLRLFGVHLVLDHPTFTNELGIPLPLKSDRITVPIHYERARLIRYPNVSSSLHE